MLVIRALIRRKIRVSACMLIVGGGCLFKITFEVSVDIARSLVVGGGVERCKRAGVMLITRFN